jgi:hypothetical protein
MSLKMPTIQTFMIEEDERKFSEIIKENFPEVVFVDIYHWPDPEPRIYDSIADCSSSISVALLNTNIVTIEEYRSRYVMKSKWHDYYEAMNIGCGLIQYLRSRPWNQNHNGLQDGRLAASYDPDKRPKTDAYVKAIYKLFRKGGVKLYFMNPETWEIQKKPNAKFFAWPEAVKQYDCVNEQFLINNNFAYLTSKHERQL